MNRDTWNGFTPDQKKAHCKGAAWLSAKMAIGNFIVSNEQALETIRKDKGVQLVAVGKEFDPIPAQFKAGAARDQYRDREELRREGPGRDHRFLREGGREVARAGRRRSAATSTSSPR